MIRPMVREDLDQVLAIQSESYIAAICESREAFEDKLKIFPSGCKVVGEGDKVHGYLICHPWSYGTIPHVKSVGFSLPNECNVIHIHDVAVAPSWRGGGIASRLADEAHRVAEAEGFEILSLVAVQGAHSFWSRHGFNRIELEDDSALHHYASGAVYMRKRFV